MYFFHFFQIYNRNIDKPLPFGASTVQEVSRDDGRVMQRDHHSCRTQANLFLVRKRVLSKCIIMNCGDCVRILCFKKRMLVVVFVFLF